jgi:dUTPase
VISYWLTGDGAQEPQRHRGAALDLRARLPGRGWRIVWGFAKIQTGVALRIPTDCVVRVTGRSGVFLRGIIAHDGLIESEFNGREVCALVYSPWPRIIRHGDRLVQMWAVGADREAFDRLEGAPQDLVPGKRGFGSSGR